MPDATIVIATYNRKDDLRRAVASALQQYGDVEVLVLDDCSTDGTGEMVQTEFPAARYVCAEQNVGYIVNRNRAADLATAPILISIDDDAEFSTTDVVSQTLQNFNDPRIGAVAIPFIDVKVSPAIRQAGPDAESTWLIASFIGTAYAIRKDVFSQVGRFREEFRHQGEESDLCLRMLDQGYVVRRGTAEPILHHESPKRVRARIMKYASRNWVIGILYGYPMPEMLLHLAVKNFNALRLCFRRASLAPLQGMLAGYAHALPRLKQRKPVRRSTLALFERLRRGGPLRLEEAAIPPTSAGN
jgi:glycosyltransferase involved in cell wall biosynthesis